VTIQDWIEGSIFNKVCKFNSFAAVCCTHKGFALWTHQGLCPWTPQGAPPLDPVYSHILIIFLMFLDYYVIFIFLSILMLFILDFAFSYFWVFCYFLYWILDFHIFEYFDAFYTGFWIFIFCKYFGAFCSEKYFWWLRSQPKMLVPNTPQKISSDRFLKLDTISKGVMLKSFPFL
jgi:hypothetical protein